MAHLSMVRFFGTCRSAELCQPAHGRGWGPRWCRLKGTLQRNEVLKPWFGTLLLCSLFFPPSINPNSHATVQRPFLLRMLHQLHVVHGHHFRATHYTLPPACGVCEKLVVGLGKAVYRCEACGLTCHKKCHIACDPCQMAPTQ